ncbi:MAG TPA: class I SAM-dependent methyltransferase [Thermoanaerobaculia bacterium]|nr:class I SAM-dependent methyltransferase [Thermoanaerobaculia bacterium]
MNRLGPVAYRCIQCNTDLAPRDNEPLVCAVCQASYPALAGIRLFLSNPDQALRSLAAGLAHEQQESTAGRARLAALTGASPSPAAVALAAGGYDRQLANLQVIERAILPVQEYLAKRPPPRSLFADFNLAGGGLASLGMLQYFWRDWSATDEARFLTRLFSGALQQLEIRPESLVVVGCGACGLVRDLAESYPRAPRVPRIIGLDLAVDSLLLANALLDGAELELHFTFPRPQIPLSQKAVRLQGSAWRPAGIELVAANVNRLPFASASVPCVLTPYLLDIVPSPRTAVAEIRRVLAPGGVWINFSNPFNFYRLEGGGTPGAGSPDALDHLDLPAFLARSGFSLRDQAMHRFTLLDQSALSEWAPAMTQTPVFFVAERISLPDRQRPDPFGEHFAGRGDAIWRRTPRISTYLAVVEEKIFTGRGVEEVKRVAAYSFGNSRPLARESALVAEWLLRQLDGARTLREIFDRSRAEFGELVQADEFLRLFRDLQDAELVELEATDEGGSPAAPGERAGGLPAP